MAVRARRCGRGLAYQLLELLTAGGTRVFVDGHDVDTPNDPEMVSDDGAHDASDQQTRDDQGEVAMTLAAGRSE